MSGEITRVFRTLVSGFHNIRLSSDELLQSTTRLTAEAPSLVWRIGPWNSSVWQSPFIFKIDWDVPSILTVKCEPGDPTPLLAAIEDLEVWSGNISGLPLDEYGELVTDLQRRLMLEERGKLSAIVDRNEGGPWIKNIRPRPSEADDSFAVCDVIWHVGFTIDTTPKDDSRARVFEVGQNIFYPNHSNNAAPDDEPYSIPLAATADTTAQGPYVKPFPVVKHNGAEVKAGFPPVVHDQPALDGPDPSNTIHRLDAIPGAFSLAALATKQMLGMAVFADGGTQNVTAQATWQSSSDAVATVDSSGLVTGVAAGSATITATYNGISGTASVSVA